MTIFETLFQRKQSPEIAQLRDELIRANTQVVFLQSMLRPKREVRKDASRYSKAKQEKTAQLKAELAAKHEDGFAKAVRLGAWDGLKLGKGTP